MIDDHGIELVGVGLEVDGILLTWGEVVIAAVVGVLRHVENRRADRPTRIAFDTTSDTGFMSDIRGALGEMAFAKLYNRYWMPLYLGDRHPSELDGDVGKSQVRTRPTGSKHLLLHEWDKDGAAYFLFLGPKYEQHGMRLYAKGWIRGSIGKDERWWKDIWGYGHPCFCIPLASLEAMPETV